MKKQEIKKLLEQEQAHNEKLQKELDSAKSTNDMWYRAKQDAEKAINEMHTMFDGIEGCVDRYVEKKESYGGCSTVELSLPSRFASYQQTLINKQ